MPELRFDRSASEKAGEQGSKEIQNSNAAQNGKSKAIEASKSSGIGAQDENEAKLLPLLDRIRTALKIPDASEAYRVGLLSDITRLQQAVETPFESLYRMGHQQWQNAALRIALDLGVFDALINRTGNPISAEELASTCAADVVFLVRIMRGMYFCIKNPSITVSSLTSAVVVAVGLCSESGVEVYASNTKTEILTTTQGISSFKMWFDIAMPVATRYPEYMRCHNYENPTQNTDSGFRYATGSEFWEYLKNTPENAKTFNDFMATRRVGKPVWYDIYPIYEELSCQDMTENDILLIDIGGNRGHDLVNLTAKYPDLPGKLVLQDLPDVVAHASFNTKANIKAMPHNFFEPQPIQNARGYHFRSIFHDWPDDACLRILQHTAAAMKPAYSKLLISEFVLPNTDTGLFPASLDMQMMGLHAGMERSEKQWRALLSSAGLEIVKIWQKVRGGEGVIEARLKDPAPQR